MSVVRNIEAVQAQPVPGVDGLTIRWLLSQPEGAPNFAMRVAELAAGHVSARHAHAWEHEMFILSGQAELWTEGKLVPIKEGDAIFIPPQELHQLINSSTGVLRFMCIIPMSGVQ